MPFLVTLLAPIEVGGEDGALGIGEDELGPDQAPRQKGANQGTGQNGVVSEANDGFAYPAVADVIRLEITVAK